MEKETILAKAQAESRGRDEADLDAQRRGAWLAYLVGVIGILAVDTVNGLVFGQVNRGPDMVICLMAMTAFAVKYRRLGKKHELLVAVCYGVLTVLFAVFWFFQLCGER